MDFRTNKKGKKYPINARDKDKNKLNLDPEKINNQMILVLFFAFRI